MLHHEFLTYLKILHFPDIGWQNSLCLQWLVLLHGNESGWPDPDCLDPAGSGSYRILKNTGYPTGSGSRSGAPLVQSKLFIAAAPRSQMNSIGLPTRVGVDVLFVCCLVCRRSTLHQYKV